MITPELLDKARTLLGAQLHALTLKERARVLPALYGIPQALTHRAPLRFKSAQGVERSYQKNFRDIVAQGAWGDLSPREASAALRKEIKAGGEKMYMETLKEEGIIFSELSDDEQRDIEREIKEWIAGQVAHVGDLVKAMKETAALKNKQEKIAARNALIDRVDYWVASLNALYSLAYASAKSDVIGTWKMGRTEKHCLTCRRLNNKSHRLSWFKKNGYIPREPASKTLECHGYNCDCKIVDSRGRQLLPQ